MSPRRAQRSSRPLPLSTSFAAEVLEDRRLMSTVWGSIAGSAGIPSFDRNASQSTFSPHSSSESSI